MSISFVDLNSQYERLRTTVHARIDTVLQHGKYILGPEVGELEQYLAEYCGAKHVVGVSSGSDALLMALMAHGIGPGDAVLLPAFTFTATAEVVLLVGARPVFVDVDADTFNVSPESLNAAIDALLQEGRYIPRAIIAVDLYGLPAPYAALAEIAERHDMLLVADAAQSFGAEQGEQRVGSLAPVSATSFFPAKPLGGYGDGGALFTDDEELADRFRSIRAHGKGGEKYDIIRVGLNARLDTLQAAILLAKLEVFDEELAARRKLADAYDNRLGNVVNTPSRVEGSKSAWAQYTIQVENRDEVAAALKSKGVPTAVYYPLPMHKQTAYAEFAEGAGDLSVSEGLSKTVLSLPMQPYLSDQEVETICDAVQEVVLESTDGT
jgi:UDP-2-acetamido-2-deoxy-ribo-hexuluronate aminotransferase